MTNNPYNKYCLDCRKNQTTHFLTWLGIFVCGECAEEHRVTFGGNQYTYVKDVLNEHWDDYQLRAIAFGGNQPLFNLLKEYDVDKQPTSAKYRNACVTWYRKRHVALMDGVEFDAVMNPKPPKNWNERVEIAKAQFEVGKQEATTNFSRAGSIIKEKSVIFGSIVSEKSKDISEKAKTGGASLKEKIQTKEYGKKLMTMFGKKDQAAANDDNKPVVEQKLEEEKIE